MMRLEWMLASLLLLAVAGCNDPPTSTSAQPASPKAAAIVAAPTAAPERTMEKAPPLADSPASLRPVQRAFECFNSDIDLDERLAITDEDPEYADYAVPADLKVFGLKPVHIGRSSGLGARFDASVETLLAAFKQRHPDVKVKKWDAGNYSLELSDGPPSGILRQDDGTLVSCGG
jgi:hypothetical protein